MNVEVARPAQVPKTKELPKIPNPAKLTSLTSMPVIPATQLKPQMNVEVARPAQVPKTKELPKIPNPAKLTSLTSMPVIPATQLKPQTNAELARPAQVTKTKELPNIPNPAKLLLFPLELTSLKTSSPMVVSAPQLQKVNHPHALLTTNAPVPRNHLPLKIPRHVNTYE